MFSKRGLVVFRIGGGDGGVCGKLALCEAVEAVGLAGEGDAVGDIWPFTVEPIGIDDEGAYVPAGQGGHDKAHHRGSDRYKQPAHARPQDAAGEGDHRAQCQRRRDEQHAGQSDVRVGVVDSVEDGVMLKQQLEAADILMDSQREAAEIRRQWKRRARAGKLRRSVRPARARRLRQAETARQARTRSRPA